VFGLGERLVGGLKTLPFGHSGVRSDGVKAGRCAKAALYGETANSLKNNGCCLSGVETLCCTLRDWLGKGRLVRRSRSFVMERRNQLGAFAPFLRAWALARID